MIGFILYWIYPSYLSINLPILFESALSIFQERTTKKTPQAQIY